MSKPINLKLAVGAAASLITVVGVGCFIADYNNTKKAREDFVSMCPHFREVHKKATSTLRDSIGLDTYNSPLATELRERLNVLKADIRQCDELGY